MRGRQAQAPDLETPFSAPPGEIAPGKRTMTEDIVARPLPAAERAQFEATLGADLSDVRVHTGPSSVQMAADLGARAFTVGNDIHFAEGQYRPGDGDGALLLAHEVAHTVQQAHGGERVQLKAEGGGGGGDPAEGAADASAKTMTRPQVQVGSSGDAVKELQEKLTAAGHDCGVADGKFGPKTRAAVVAFQQKNGL